MIDKQSEILGLVEQAERNIVLKCGVSKKNFVMSALRVVIGEQEYIKQEPLISQTVDVLVDLANDPNILNFAKTTCCCLSKKYTKQT